MYRTSLLALLVVPFLCTCLLAVENPASAAETNPTQEGTSPSADQEKPAKPKRKVNPVLETVAEDEDLPRVLLIGDSISMGYTLDVRRMLAGKANVQRPNVNCGPTTRGLAELDKWLKTGGADKTWDVIHFNWGLHDLKYMGKDGSNLADPEAEGSHQQVPPEEYRKNLSELVRRLKQTNAKLIWRNTTPVPEGAKGRVVGDSKKYNQIAAEIMAKEQVQIHDLFDFAFIHQAEIQRKADVHYTKEGSERLAKEVVVVISKALELDR